MVIVKRFVMRINSILYKNPEQIVRPNSLKKFIDDITFILVQYENEVAENIKRLKHRNRHLNRAKLFNLVKDQKWTMNIDPYTPLEISLLGQGEYGMAFKIQNLKNGISYAGKIQPCDSSFKKELEAFKQVSEAVNKYDIPNFPKLYASSKLKTKGRRKKICALYMKTADGTLYKALENSLNIKNYLEFIGLVRQMIITIYLFRKFANLYHCDTHLDNFFIIDESHSPRGDCWLYHFPFGTVMVPYFGRTVQIFDYGETQHRKRFIPNSDCNYLTDFKKAIDDLNTLGIQNDAIYRYVSSLKKVMNGFRYSPFRKRIKSEVIAEALFHVPPPIDMDLRECYNIVDFNFTDCVLPRK